jgi:uncharacterized protein YbjT (DUF2867 family)
MKPVGTNLGSPVAVLGATGKVGSQVLQFLSNANIASKALTRDLARSKPLPHTAWLRGDLNNDSDLRNFLVGSKKLFLNSGVQQNMVELQCHIIDVARELGVEYILKLSTPGARQDAENPVGEWHWRIEEHLKTSGLSWNALHPQSFMQNWLGDIAETAKAEKKIYDAAGEGRRAFIDTRDIGEAAAALFTDPGAWVNSIISLSGAKPVSYYEVADAITLAIGEKVVYIAQTPEEAWERYQKKGMPQWAIETFIGIALNQRSGAAEGLVSQNVSKLLGKPARSIYDFARDYAQAFK